MNKAYTRTNWKNSPSTDSPINETNLNKIELGLDTIDDRVIVLDSAKANASDMNTLVSNVTFEEATGIFTITKKNGTTTTIDTKLEKIATNWTYDEDTQQIVLTLDDGTKQYIDLSSLISNVDFANTGSINFTVTNGVVSADVKDGSVTEAKLEPNYLANVKLEVTKAQTASTNATTASTNATAEKLKAEGWAVGQQNGTDVDATSPYYHNNAKYYKDQAQAVSKVDIATTTVPGIVKPDGTTITVESDGTIHSVGLTSVDWDDVTNKPSIGSSLDYDEDNSELSLKDENGNVLSTVTIEGGGSPTSSTITVSTEDYDGKTVTLYYGSTEVSSQDFVNKVAIFNVTTAGNYKISCEGQNVNITVNPIGLPYTATINMPSVTLNISTTESALQSATVKIYKGDDTSGTYIKSVTLASGSASTTLNQSVLGDITTTSANLFFEVVGYDGGESTTVSAWTSYTVKLAFDSVALVPTMTSNTEPSGVCSASSQYVPMFAPYVAFMGNTSYGWLSSVGSLPQWIQYQFETPQIITGVEYNPHSHTYEYASGNSIELRASNDSSFSTYVTLWDSNGNGHTTNEVKRYTFSNDNGYLYARLIVNNIGPEATESCATLKLVQFFGQGEIHNSNTPNDVSNWIAQAGRTSDFPYTTMSQVLADNTCLLALMSDENAMKYLARSTDFITDICGNESAMTYLGQSAYADDTVLKSEAWCVGIINSTYFEKVYTVQIPNMTSATSPYGTVTSSGFGNASFDDYMAFSKSGVGLVYSVGYLQYQAVQDMDIRALYLKFRPSTNYAVGIDVEISNDGSTWEKIHYQYLPVSSETQLIYKVNITNKKARYIKFTHDSLSFQYIYTVPYGRS